MSAQYFESVSLSGLHMYQMYETWAPLKRDFTTLKWNYIIQAYNIVVVISAKLYFPSK